MKSNECQTLPLGRNSPTTSTCWGWPAGNQLSRKGPGGHQVDHEPAACPCSTGGQQTPGLCLAVCCQQVEGGDAPLYSVLVGHLESCVLVWASQYERHIHSSKPSKAPQRC